MSGGTAIKVENLGKKFIIGHRLEGDLRGSFSQRLSRLMARDGGGTREEFWALKDVSFEIKKGEAVGIIGRNGAGKSTLLKILSRITDPSKGRFEINGRVSSLLEVGTGFHPELTGRENIYLNGTILGMRRAEIRKKFDAIVDFSGVEKFLDTPVKHYSSGMKVRLAFSVAAHLEPEILIIDEVLAVGDAEFQRKCLGKMDEVSKGEGRTVLFVSHNMGAVESLCTKGIVVSQGRVVYQGHVTDTVRHYLQMTSSEEVSNDRLNEHVSIEEFSLSSTIVRSLEPLDLTLKLVSDEENEIHGLAILFYNSLNDRVAILDLREGLRSQKSSKVEINATIHSLPFIEGEYKLGVFVKSRLCVGDFLNLRELIVEGASRNFTPYARKYRGLMELKADFKTR
ncbi:MAG TPA: ABC transporter ATP-binding protein [Cyclobacteriaceae bacterium]